MKTLDGKKAIQFGWEATKANFWFFLGIMAMLYVTSRIIPSFFDTLTSHGNTGAWELVVAGSIISGLLSAFMRLGLAKVSLRAVDKKPLAYQDFFTLQDTYWPYVIASILFGIAVAVGTILLIIPGVIIGLMWMFYMYLILDKKLSPLDALKESAKMTSGYKWQLLGFAVILMLINIGGALLLGIGLLWTIPLSAIALAHMYRQLV